ncbi:hypothetical protein CEUSTIGMA_g13377.t1 [Chlamydomonas eustigma]|uniref:Uncharacterized protein n=1 Tax=Chlamydomonas eustigma TaxID=1157962 RepID=A0A250XS93_9CHLO|nr:hypothetical protein CEUSTIGMA_g13377.t1 [Chlamydomonas eustigma]|eukprot:GAX85961.1 hypothetical protein CEUSTIGMA_g13377.t1 [Chlamydomonas eustigma]
MKKLGKCGQDNASNRAALKSRHKSMDLKLSGHVNETSCRKSTQHLMCKTPASLSLSTRNVNLLYRCNSISYVALLRKKNAAGTVYCAKDVSGHSSMEPPGLLPDASNLKNLARQMIEEDPEMQQLLQKYREAMMVVDRAKSASEKLDKEFAQLSKDSDVAERQEAALQKLKASQVMADAEVAAAEKLLQAAEIENARAQLLKDELSNQAKADAGRVESGKAAACAVVGGSLGLLPFVSLYGGDIQQLSTLLGIAAAVASCALFGVTYRYAVGTSPNNTDLKGGVVAAFGLVRAASAADVLQHLSPEDPFTMEVVGPAALYAGQSVLMFAFAAIAIEAAFRQGLIQRVDSS